MLLFPRRDSLLACVALRPHVFTKNAILESGSKRKKKEDKYGRISYWEFVYKNVQEKNNMGVLSSQYTTIYSLRTK